MQSAVLGPASGPLQKLWTITMPNPQYPQYPNQATLVGVSATGLSVILVTPPAASRGGGYGSNLLTVYQNALPLWPQPQPIDRNSNCQQQSGCNFSVAFDDAFIYVATIYQPQPQYPAQSFLQVFNLTTGATTANGNLSPFPGVALSLLANAADAPSGGALLWAVGNTSAFAGAYSVAEQDLVGQASNLTVAVAECTLAHQSFAVCLLGGAGGMAVLRADAAGLVGPALAWDDYVKPLFIAKDVGASGALVVDTDYGGFSGGTLVACDLATGAALWTWQKPANATLTAFAYSGAGVLVLKSFFDDGAQFAVRFDTFALNATALAIVSSAAAPAFPPAAPPFEDYLTLDGPAANAYTTDSDGGSILVLAVKVGVSGAGAISTLLSDRALQAPAALVAGPKATQLSVQFDPYTVAVYM